MASIRKIKLVKKSLKALDKKDRDTIGELVNALLTVQKAGNKSQKQKGEKQIEGR